MGSHHSTTTTTTRRESHFKRWNGPRLHQVSGIDANQLRHVHQEFKRVAGSDGLVDPQEFAQLYRENHLGPEDPASIERAFQTFDRDGSGNLSFDEFLSATVMLNKNVDAQDRVTYLIDSNNPIGVESKYITPDYGRTIVRNLNRFYGTNANFDEIWSKLDPVNGQVDREEFVSFLSSSPAFAQVF